MLDSVKIYGKTKEQFGWPEDPPEDFSSASVNNVCSPNLNQGNGSSDGDIVTPTTTSRTVLERYDFCVSQFTHVMLPDAGCVILYSTLLMYLLSVLSVTLSMHISLRSTFVYPS